jgi:hypothetical protein
MGQETYVRRTLHDQGAKQYREIVVVEEDHQFDVRVFEGQLAEGLAERSIDQDWKSTYSFSSKPRAEAYAQILIDESTAAGWILFTGRTRNALIHR